MDTSFGAMKDLAREEELWEAPADHEMKTTNQDRTSVKTERATYHNAGLTIIFAMGSFP
jgi:hypothetical protein